MKTIYTEGPAAGENFRAFASAVLQAKKITAPAKVTKRVPRRKASGKDKS